MKFKEYLAVCALLASSSTFAGLAEHAMRTRVDGADVIIYSTSVKDVVTIIGSLPAGDAFADEKSPAVATLTGIMLDKGTTRADKFVIAQQLESVGASISFNVGVLTTSVHAKCLRKDAPTILRLIAEQLRTPSFPAAEFEKSKKQLAGALQRSMEDTDYRASIAFARAIYPAGHPNHHVATEDMLAAIGGTQLEEIKAFHKKHYGPAHLTFVIVGDLDPKQIVSELKKDFRGWTGGIEVLRAERAQPLNVPQAQTLFMADKTSVSIVLGQVSGVRYSDADAIPLRVGAAVLGSGFTSRLTATVRDKEGLTYNINAYMDNDTYTDGDWRISASFAPELLDQGLASTRRELKTWWRSGVTADELKARKSDLIGSYKVSLATTDGLAGFILRTVQRGRPLSWLDDYPKAIDALTLEQVNGVIRKYLNPDKMALIEAGSVPGAK